MNTAEKIIRVFTNRKGFDGWWGNIEEEYREEIVKEIQNLISPQLNKPFLLVAGHDYDGEYWIDKFSTEEEARKIVEVFDELDYKAGIYSLIKINGSGYDWFDIINLETWKPD